MTEVELPDGTILELPDGATPAQAQAAARKYLQSVRGASGAAQGGPVQGGPQPAAQGPVEGPGGAAFGVFPKSGKGRQMTEDRLGKIQTGVANAGIETYLGGKQLLKDLSPEELEVLRLSRQDVKDAGGFAGVGQVLGHGGVAAAGAVSAPARLVKALSALKGAAPAVTSGVEAAALTPVEDQENKYTEKLKEGGKAAATAGALQVGGRVLKKAATQPFRPSADAKTLMAQGIIPTLQQGADGRIGELIGGLAAGSTSVPRRQGQEVLDAITHRATGNQASLPKGTLAERIGIIKHSLDKDYEDLLGGLKFPMSKGIREEAVDAARSVEQSGGRFANEANTAGSIVKNVVGDSSTRTALGYKKLAHEYLDALEENIKDYQPSRVQEGIRKARKVIMERSRNAPLAPEELELLRDIDSRMFDLNRLKESAVGARGQESGVSVRKLADSYGNTPAEFGNTTNEELIGPAFRTLGRTEHANASRSTLLNWRRAAGLGTLGAGAAFTGLGAPTAAVLAPLYATSVAGQTRGGARYLLGDFDWQKKLKGALESQSDGQMSMANMLRALRDSNQLGYVLSPGE